MRSPAALLWLPLLPLFPLLVTPCASAGEVRVHLFGQPCLLSGPLSELALKSIHAISPEQMPPAPSNEQVRGLQERLIKSASTPPALERYREQLGKRLDAQVAFHDGVAAAKRAGKPEALLDGVKDYLQPRRAKEFEALARAGKWGPAAVDQLYDTYNDTILAHPEEEFHRAIGRIKVRYSCSFEEGDAS